MYPRGGRHVHNAGSGPNMRGGDPVWDRPDNYGRGMRGGFPPRGGGDRGRGFNRSFEGPPQRGNFVPRGSRGGAGFGPRGGPHMMDDRGRGGFRGGRGRGFMSDESHFGPNQFENDQQVPTHFEQNFRNGPQDLGPPAKRARGGFPPRGGSRGGGHSGYHEPDDGFPNRGFRGGSGGFPPRGSGRGFRGSPDGHGFPPRGRGGRGEHNMQGYSPSVDQGLTGGMGGPYPDQGPRTEPQPGFSGLHVKTESGGFDDGPRGDGPGFGQMRAEFKREENIGFPGSQPHSMPGSFRSEYKQEEQVPFKNETVSFPQKSFQQPQAVDNGQGFTYFGEDPEFDDSFVILDWYNSDLELEINPATFCSARAISKGGFAYLWAGVRATYGATAGKVCFEVCIDGNADCSHLENEPTPNVLRVGWSVDDSSLQLGEEPLSYGFGGTAKCSTRRRFTDYGRRFGVGDVIGCYLDLTQNPITISYTINGNSCGVAFDIQKHELKGQALFPHIFTKNQHFTVNFGQLREPMRPILPGYRPIGHLTPKDGLVRGALPPRTKQDCEVLMMVGLPGAGKTYWAQNWMAKYTNKKYNILGTNAYLDRMKVMNLSRWRNYHGRWDVLIQKCTECFDEILKIASKRRRNFILDQTNVYPTARGRKLKDFYGFDVKAVVVVPPNDEYIRRSGLRAEEEGKAVPEEAVLNMKANFVLPDVEEQFSDVLYTDLPPEEACVLVKQYNAEAISKGQSMTNGVKNFIRRNETQRARMGINNPIGRLVTFSPRPGPSGQFPGNIDDSWRSQPAAALPDQPGPSQLIPSMFEQNYGRNFPQDRNGPARMERIPGRDRTSPQMQDGWRKRPGSFSDFGSEPSRAMSQPERDTFYDLARPDRHELLPVRPDHCPSGSSRGFRGGPRGRGRGRLDPGSQIQQNDGWSSGYGQESSERIPPFQRGYDQPTDTRPLGLDGRPSQRQRPGDFSDSRGQSRSNFPPQAQSQPGQSFGGTGESGTPDYTALMQHLQYYQSEMSKMQQNRM